MLEQKLKVLVLAVIVLLMIALAGSLLVRGCPSSRHGYGAVPPISRSAA